METVKSFTCSKTEREIDHYNRKFKLKLIGCCLLMMAIWLMSALPCFLLDRDLIMGGVLSLFIIGVSVFIYFVSVKPALKVRSHSLAKTGIIIDIDTKQMIYKNEQESVIVRGEDIKKWEYIMKGAQVSYRTPPSEHSFINIYLKQRKELLQISSFFNEDFISYFIEHYKELGFPEPSYVLRK